MAKNITLLGASYTGVPAVNLPQTGGGTATFTDTSDANATAADIANGKTAYVNGVKVTGTASGGGGGNVQETKNVSISENGDYTILPDQIVSFEGDVNYTSASPAGFKYACPDLANLEVGKTYQLNITFYDMGRGLTGTYSNDFTFQGYYEDSSQQITLTASKNVYVRLYRSLASQGYGIFVNGSSSDSLNGTISFQTNSYDSIGEVNVSVDVGGGGASNYVTGEFTTGSTAGVTNITIPYTGNGYPIAAMVFVKGGAYNNTSTGDTDWYNSVQRYAVGQWTMHKSVQSSTPTYSTSGTQNQGVVTAIYKNSTSSSTSYTRTSSMNSNAFSSSNASNTAATSVRFKSDTTLSYYVNTSSYGLLPNTTYVYHIIYSE